MSINGMIHLARAASEFYEVHSYETDTEEKNSFAQWQRVALVLAGTVDLILGMAHHAGRPFSPNTELWIALPIRAALILASPQSEIQNCTQASQFFAGGAALFAATRLTPLWTIGFTLFEISQRVFFATIRLKIFN